MYLIPILGDVVGIRPTRLVWSEVIDPASRFQESGDALEQRGLAGAVAAHAGDDLARLHAEVDVEQDLRFAVGDVQAADRQYFVAVIVMTPLSEACSVPSAETSICQ